MLFFDFINPYVVYMSIVLLFVLSIYVIFKYGDYLKKHKNAILAIVSILLIWTQLVRYVFSVYRGGGVTFSDVSLSNVFSLYGSSFDVAKHLPFYVCRLSVVILLYYTITKDKRVESFLFYWGATGLAGVIYPNGPISNIVNLTETFYIDHFFLGLTPFFLLVVQGYKPIRNDLVKITVIMFGLLLVFIPINDWLNASNISENVVDYFYLTDMSIFGVMFPNLPTKFLGINFPHLPSIIFAITHTLAAFGFFSVYYFSFKGKEISENL